MSLGVQGRRGRKPKVPIATLECGFRDTRTRRPRLSSWDAWRREMRFVYRETLEGRLPSGEATRLVYIITNGANLEMQAANSEAIRRIEARIAALEGTTPTFIETPFLTHEDAAGAAIAGELGSSEALAVSAEGL